MTLNLRKSYKEIPKKKEAFLRKPACELPLEWTQTAQIYRAFGPNPEVTRFAQVASAWV